MPIAAIPRDLASRKPLPRQLAVARITYQPISLQSAVLVNVVDGRGGRTATTVPNEVLGAHLAVAGVGLLFGEEVVDVGFPDLVDEGLRGELFE